MGFGSVVVVAMPADAAGRRNIAGSERRPCTICKREVTVSRATLARSDLRHPESAIQCVFCADIVGLELRAPTDAQRAELAAAGHEARFALEKLTSKVLTEEHVARLRARLGGPAASGGIVLGDPPRDSAEKDRVLPVDGDSYIRWLAGEGPDPCAPEHSKLPEYALSLYQPWAWLVAQGLKPIENRPKRFSQKGFRGPFWIHASKLESMESPDDEWHAARKLCDEIIGPDFVLPALTELAFGAIIGRAVITGSIPPKGGLFPTPPVPWHFPDQYGLIVENAVPLAVPVPCRGFQGFFRPKPEVQAELRKAAT